MGGDNNKAQKAADRRERERQAAIAQGTAAVDRVYSSPEREAQYADFANATRDYYTQDLGRQKQDADLQAKFALARTGLTGGSRAIDLGRELGEGYTKGLLDVERMAQGAEADLRGADQQSKMNLLAQVQGGMDATTAANNAATALRNNLLSGRASSRADSLGNLFGTVADFNIASESAKERRRAEQMYGQSMYQPIFNWGGT